MAKFKIGEQVRIKSTHEIGQIKSREIIKGDGNRIRVEYIVKLGEGINKWKGFTRKEIEKVNKPEETRQIVSITTQHKGYNILVLGFTENFNDVIKFKTFSVGYAICSPEDEYNIETGVKIALHRAKKHPFARLWSGHSGEFNEATAKNILMAKSEYIIDNFEKFIHRR